MPHTCTRCNMLEFRGIVLNSSVLLTHGVHGVHGVLGVLCMYPLRARQQIPPRVPVVIFPDGCIHGNKNRDVHTL